MSIKSVQRGEATVPSDQTIANIPISSVNMSKAFITRSYTSVSNNNVAYTAVKARLTSSTNLELTRHTFLPSDGALSVAWEIVEYN